MSHARCLDRPFKTILPFNTSPTSDFARGMTVTINKKLIDFAKDQGNNILECECDEMSCILNSIKWYHNGRRLEDFADPTRYMIISEKLHLTTPSRRSLGVYQCESDGVKSEESIVKNSCKLIFFLTWLIPTRFLLCSPRALRKWLYIFTWSNTQKELAGG